MRASLLFLLLAVVAALPAAAQGFTVDFNQSVDFLSVSSYAWAKGTPARHQKMQRLLVAAVDEGLADAGWKRVSDAPDLRVAIHVLVDVHTLAELDNPDSWEYWTGIESVAATDIQAGTLIIDLIDPETEDVIWRGLASGAVNAVPEKNQKKVLKAIRKMLRQLPREDS